jgi:hypothetical protein
VPRPSAFLAGSSWRSAQPSGARAGASAGFFSLPRTDSPGLQYAAPPGLKRDDSCGKTFPPKQDRLAWETRLSLFRLGLE